MSCSWRTRCYSEALAKESYKSIIRHSESRRGDESQMTVIEIHRFALNDKGKNTLPFQMEWLGVMQTFKNRTPLLESVAHFVRTSSIFPDRGRGGVPSPTGGRLGWGLSRKGVKALYLSAWRCQYKYGSEV